MTFYERYKNLINRIQKFKVEEIVFWSIQKLRQKDKENFEDDRNNLPWEMLTLLQLAFLHGEKRFTTKRASENDMWDLIKRIRFTSEESPILNQDTQSKLSKFLRTVAHQQFWFQKRLSSWELGRQILLFHQIECKYPCKDKFQHYMGIDLLNFYEVSLLIHVLAINNQLNRKFNSQFLKDKYNHPSIDTYLNILSIKWNDAKEILSQSFKIKDPQLQLLEQTPFIRYPFIQCPDGSYIYISTFVFEECLRSYAYDLFKSKDQNLFSQEFGKTTFEKYIEIGLNSSKLNYKGESELKTLLGDPNKLVDFTIFEEDCTVFIECKAIEMKPYTKAFPVNSVLSNELKSSITKGVKQILSFANAYINKYKTSTQQEYFGLIITYKELYLGPNNQVWEEYLKDDLEKFISENEINKNLLPPENIFFISIECFDLLLATLNNSQHSIKSILKYASECNKEPNKQKFLLDQYLETDFHVENYTIPYLEAETTKIFNRISTNLGFGEF